MEDECIYHAEDTDISRRRIQSLAAVRNLIFKNYGRKSWSNKLKSICIIVSNILRACGYSKLIVKVFPLTIPGRLNALKLDVPSLFSLFCSSKTRNFDIFDFEGNVIVSRQSAIENKNAIPVQPP